MSNVAPEISPISATSTLPAPIQVLLIGDDRDPELAPVVARVAALVDQNRFIVRDIGEALALIQNLSCCPDLVVALQSWSDQFSHSEVLNLLSRLPLARVVCVAGAGCDSDGRTRASWPLAVRARVPDALSRIERELEILRSSPATDGSWRPDPSPERPTPIVLPWTASRAEIFEAEFSNDVPPLPPGLKLVVESPDRAFRAMLERLLGPSLYVPTIPGESGTATIVLVDVDPWIPRLQPAPGALKAGRSGAKVIACTGTLASDHLEGLKTAGADAVWFKLSSLAALSDLIRMCGTP